MKEGAARRQGGAVEGRILAGTASSKCKVNSVPAAVTENPFPRKKTGKKNQTQSEEEEQECGQFRETEEKPEQE